MDIESKRRSIVKSLTYRAFTTIILGLLTFVLTENLYQTSIISIAFAILATIAYYAHERMWNKIKWK
jgi:uncharacterized membrane protein